MTLSDQGRMSYHAGLSAELQVAQDYERRGFEIAHSRWRGAGGEIDLITRNANGLVFVEIKKSHDFSRAAEGLKQKQMARLYATAEEFLAGEPNGPDTDVRFDVALVNGVGELQIIENAFGQG